MLDILRLTQLSRRKQTFCPFITMPISENDPAPPVQSSAPRPLENQKCGISQQHRLMHVLAFIAILSFAFSLYAVHLDAGNAAVVQGDDRPRHDERQPAMRIIAAHMAEFFHTFAICFYGLTAPIDLILIIAYHRRHGLRIPRTCLCSSGATVGGVLCLIGWMFAFWLSSVGLAIVAAAHVVHIACEHRTSGHTHWS